MLSAGLRCPVLSVKLYTPIVIAGPSNGGSSLRFDSCGFICTSGGACIDLGTSLGIQLHPASVTASNIATMCFKS
jgi:hypothetical protein